MNKKINKKYLKEIKKINKKYMKLDDDIDIFDNVSDNELFYYSYDDLLLKLLDELGYKDIVKEYDNARCYFWYS